MDQSSAAIRPGKYWYVVSLLVLVGGIGALAFVIAVVMFLVVLLCRIRCKERLAREAAVGHGELG